MGRNAKISIIVLCVAALITGVWLAMQPDRAPAPTANADLVADTPSQEDKPLEAADRTAPPENAPAKPSPVPKDPPPEPKPEETPPSPEEGNVVAGVVISKLTKEPIAGANVGLILTGRRPAFEATTESDGAFRFELAEGTELSPEARVYAWHPDYKYLRQPASTGTITLALDRATIVAVTFEGSNCRPENAWLRRTDDKEAGGDGADFDPFTGVARIALRNPPTEETTCVACTQWFGQLIESQPITVRPGETSQVTLTAPEGASIRVRVLGPDARPMPGVVAVAGVDSAKYMYAVTDSEGEILFAGIPAPKDVRLQLGMCEDGAFCVAPQSVRVATIGDFTEVLFDLTGTGTVDCAITYDGEHVFMLGINGPTESGVKTYQQAVLRASFGNGGALPRIYGLKPGTYMVMPQPLGHGNLEPVEFRVEPPPLISEWHRDFQSRRLVVHVRGAPAEEGMHMYHWVAGRWPGTLIAPDENGDFVLTGLPNTQFFIRVWGETCGTGPIEVSPEAKELFVDVVRCGTLELLYTPGHAKKVKITGAEPGSLSIAVDVGSGPIVLPPGRYTITDDWLMGAPWKPVEVVVIAGEVVECRVGPEVSSKLRLRVKDRASLWSRVTLLQNGQEIEYLMVEMNNRGDEYWDLQFGAEGEITLVIKIRDYEDFETTVVVKRDETTPVEIELKRKQ